jgi:excisionase family DNA binding protein
MTLDKQERHWLRIDEVAARLDVHPMTAYRWARERRLPVVQLGGAGSPIRVDEDALERWISEHGSPGA